MGNYMVENDLEVSLIEHLRTLGYEYKKDIKFMNQLKANLWIELEKLNNIIFSEQEKRRLERDIFDRPDISILECANLWTSTYPLDRDDGSVERIRFVRLDELSANTYQVINQLTVQTRVGAKEQENRYDVMILINGIPLVAIELKKTGKQYKEGSALKEAFSQICRYRRDSYRGVLNFIRMFVISDKIDSKYFSNNEKVFNSVTGDEEGLSWGKTFYWTDVENNRVSNLYKLADSMLNRERIMKMITRDCVITKESMLLLRPYQVYARELAVKRVEEKLNSYIFHCTGSGKTLLTHQIGKDLSLAGKTVIFVVDRRDINSQTAKEFTTFSGDDSFLESDSTSKLARKIRSNEPFIITTVQKLSRLLNSERQEVIDKLKEKEVVLLFDECHRSVFGKMFADIQRSLPKAVFLGVTGTPIFRENKSATEMITKDRFGELIHKYLMLNAQQDGTVLGFDIKYYSPSEEENLRLEEVSRTILKTYPKLTRNRLFNAIFATSSKEMIIKYYDKLKELNKDNLKIAAIFTSENEVDGDDSIKEESKNRDLERIIEDYNKLFGDSFTLANRNDYYTSVQNRLKDKELDLVLVVDMLLTGFDSKMTNTLYVDKNLQYHRLVQAFSRVNRVAGVEKQYGNIICFTDIKENVHEAIALFNAGADPKELFAKPYVDRLEEYKKAVLELQMHVATVEDAANLKHKADQIYFIELFKAVVKAYSMICVYPDFEVDEVIPSFKYQDYLDYTAAFYSLKDKLISEVSGTDSGVVGGSKDTPSLTEADFDLQLIGAERINTQYILNLLIKAYTKDKQKRTTEEFKRIESVILASGLKDVDKQPLLNTLYNLNNSEAKTTKEQIEENTEKERERYIEKELVKFAEDKSISREKLREWYDYHNRTGVTNIPEITGYIAEHFLIEVMEDEEYGVNLLNSVITLLNNLK